MLPAALSGVAAQDRVTVPDRTPPPDGIEARNPEARRTGRVATAGGRECLPAGLQAAMEEAWRR
jgi:hypothetical protein